jgi:AraC family transcriptional regulator
MQGAVPLHFAVGEFYGRTRLAHESRGIAVTHRIADRLPEEVLEHIHSDAHFVLVTGGDYVTIASGLPRPSYPVFVFNPPGTTHRDHFERGRGSYFAISIGPAKVAAIRLDLALPNEPVHLTAMPQFAIAQRIAKCCASAPTHLSLDSLCHELLASMDHRIRDMERTPPTWLHKAIELLHDRYVEDLTVADIATSVGVHAVYLARSFRLHVGCSPAEFSRFRRLEKAAQLLVGSREPLSDIALRCGFADQSHLTKQFTRKWGMSPGQYRQATGTSLRPARRFQNDKSLSPQMLKLCALSANARKLAKRHR